MKRFEIKTSERYRAADRAHRTPKVDPAISRQIRHGKTDAEYAAGTDTGMTDPLGSWTGVPRDGGKPVQDADDL